LCTLPLYSLQSVTSVNPVEVASEVFSLAIAGSTADALEVPPSSITGLTIGANRRVLLATVGYTYTFDVLSSMTPAVIINKFKKYSSDGFFLNSLRAKSGVSIDTLSTASIVQVPSVIQAANTEEKSNKRGDRPIIAPSP
jgi:hypothetical protein